MAAISSIVIAGVAAAGAAYSANQQSKAGKAAAQAGQAGAQTAAINAGIEAGSLRFQGEEAQRVAAFEAEKVLAQAREFRGSQKALAAASGFVVDTGTAETLSQETENLAQADALAYLFDGANKHAASVIGADNLIKTGVSQAGAIMQQGYNAQAELRGKAVGTLISGFSSFASNAAVQKAVGMGGSKSAVSGGWNVGDTFKYGRE